MKPNVQLRSGCVTRTPMAAEGSAENPAENPEDEPLAGPEPLRGPERDKKKLKVSQDLSVSLRGPEV